MNIPELNRYMCVKACIFLLFMLPAFHCLYGAAGNGNQDIPGIHAIGDGNILVYGKNSDITQFFGPPYSSPSVLHLTLMGGDSVISGRIKGTAIWEHRILRNGETICSQTDFISSRAGSFVREINSDREVSYELNVALEDLYQAYNEKISVSQELTGKDLQGTNQAYTIHVPEKVPFFFVYLAPAGYTYRILVTGSASLKPVDASGKKMRLILSKGKSSLIIVTGHTEEEVKGNIKTLANNTYASLKAETEMEWVRFSEKLSPFKTQNYPEAVVSAIDDISTLLRSQQSAQGVVMAGYSWHMGYIRDQYGAFRGLMAIGLYKEARKSIQFFYDVWKGNGILHNAQSIGYPGIFHCHENDEVEITGYLVLQAIQYYEATKDRAFVMKILPMLEWAMNVQIRNLIDGMLPFNGDETYIAGGVLPRKVMADGSAEGTLLFIEGSWRMLDFIKEAGLWDEMKIRQYQSVVDDCAEKYRNNFLLEGKLMANNIERERKVSYPDTRSGVCLHPDHPVSYHPLLYHFKGSLYFCSECMKKDNSLVQVPQPEVFEIPSVGLFPLYIDSRLFTEQEKLELLEIVVNRYKSTGRIAEQSMIMGHDFGMFLTALVKANHPMKHEIFANMMSLRDNTGSWCEYFTYGSKPIGTACHPWSAGTNIEAAIRYAGSEK